MKALKRNRQVHRHRATAFLITAALVLSVCPAMMVLAAHAESSPDISPSATINIRHWGMLADGTHTDIEVFAPQTTVVDDDGSYSTSNLMPNGGNSWTQVADGDWGNVRLQGVNAYCANGQALSFTVDNAGPSVSCSGDFYLTGIYEGSWACSNHGFHVTFTIEDVITAQFGGADDINLDYYYLFENEPIWPEPPPPPPPPDSPPVSPTPPPYVPPYVPPPVVAPAEPEPIPEPPPPAAPTTSIDPSLAAHFGEIRIPEELTGVVKSVTVTKPSAETHDELSEFARSGGVELAEGESSALFELTPVVFDMVLEGEEELISELETPIHVTLILPEGADASQLMLFTKHGGELALITDFEVSEDGRSITVALQQFSPFALGVRRGNIITADAGYFGEMNPSGSVLLDIGQTRVFTFKPQVGYMVGEVCLDGVPVELAVDGTFEVTGTGADHQITVAFTKIPELDVLPVTGSLVDIIVPDDVPISDIPGAPVEPFALPPSEPRVYEVESPFGDILTQSIGEGVTRIIAPLPSITSARSILNLVLTALCMFLPMFAYFTSPVRKRGMQQTVLMQMLTVYLNVSAVLVFALFAMLEGHLSQYELANRNTPLFVLLASLSVAALAVHRARRHRAESALDRWVASVKSGSSEKIAGESDVV